MTAQTQPYFFYLLVLLFLVGGAYLFHHWHNMKNTLQQILLWWLIFFGLVTAYGFKDSFTSQLFRGAGQEVGESLIFNRADDGHFYIRLTMNGQKVVVLVDTGATNLVLDKNTARKIGLEPDGLAYIHKAQTANGVTYGASVRIDSVTLGSFTEYNVPAMVNKGDLPIPLLGMNYLNKFGELRIKQNRLILQR